MIIVPTLELKKLRRCFLDADFDIRFVGGYVRDSLLNIESNDIDLCTNANPTQQLEIYKNNNVYHYATGIEHGTITVELGSPRSEKYEITSCRIDSKTDGRHAEVEFTDDWTLDLSRRDFTINAMTFDFDGNLYDPFKGYKDLKNNIVRFVGNPDERIKEDYLRILRWYRFSGRFGNFISKDESNSTILAIKKYANGMQIISKERIWMEFKKILSHHSRNYVLKLMQTHGILPFINIYDELYKCHENIKNPVTAMVAHFRTKTYDIGKSWKWSKAEQNLAKFLIDNYNKKLDIMEGLAYYNYPREYMYELALLENRSDEDKNKIMTIEIPEFKVNGNDLMSLGFAGKQIKEELFRLKKIWRDNNYK